MGFSTVSRDGSTENRDFNTEIREAKTEDIDLKTRNGKIGKPFYLPDIFETDENKSDIIEE